MRIPPAALSLVPFLLAADAPRADLTAAERAWVAAHPVVRMMADPRYEPADFFDADGVHRGIAADVLALVAERTGLRFEVANLPLERRLVLDPDRRGADGVTISARSPERDKYYLVTRPYLEFPAYILTRRQTPGFVTPPDLAGKRVAVVAGYAAEEHMRAHHPAARYDPVPDTDAGLRKLAFGEVDALVSDIPVSTYWLEKGGFTNLKIAGETGFTYRLGISSRRDWPELHAVLEKGLATVTPDEHKAIREKWLTAPYEPFFRSRRLWLPVAVLAGLAAGGFAWVRLLARQVRRRTAELRESLELYRATVLGTADAVLLARADGSLVYASPAAADVFARPLDAVADAGVRGLLGADPGEGRNAECRVSTPAGERVLLVTATPVAACDAARLYVCRDVTDRVRLEDRVRRQQKLEAVGLLAGGLAHDFNNLLAAVRGFTDLAADDALPPADRAVYLGEVRQASDRAAHLTKQLLAFARGRPTAAARFDLSAAVREFLPLVRVLLRPCGVRAAGAAGPVYVRGDRSQVEQAVLNLCVNARDAMPGGGEIEIGLADEDRGGVRYAVLSVTDAGTGIDPVTAAKMFDPFFTTKPPGQGTGLGMTVVAGVADAHDGFVDVDTAVGRGTTVRVYLPADG